MGRKQIEIDLAAVEAAAADGLNEAEVAARLGISTDTIGRRKRQSAEFADAIKRGKRRADAEVSSQLFRKVKNGDLGAIVWWEKTRKGYADRVDGKNDGTLNVRVTYERRGNQPDPAAPSAGGDIEPGTPVQRGELREALGEGHNGN